MNRNPNKRLGAGPLDADEIKKHAWFAGINWDDVYNRKLTPPLPTLKKQAGATGQVATAFEAPSAGLSTSDNIDGWSFAVTDKRSLTEGNSA